MEFFSTLNLYCLNLAYSPSSGMISSPQGYSPSFQRSPAAYSPHSPAPGYSPHSPAPAYSPQPNYSPGNATPLCTRSPFPSPNTAPLSTRSPMPSPSIQAPEVSGNTTPHPGPSESPLSSSPRPHRFRLFYLFFFLQIMDIYKKKFRGRISANK